MPAFALLCIVLGPTMALTGRRPGTLVAGFAALAVAGVIPGLLGVPMPLAGLWTIGSLMVCGLVLVCARPVPSSWLLGVAVVAVPVHGWSMAAAVVADMSRSTAVTFGVVLVGVCLFFASLTTSRPVQWHDLRPPVRILGAFVTVVAIGWRLAEYRSWFDHEVATEAALGLARVPVLAIVLLLIAVVTWPRRRRVAEELGAGGRGTARNMALAGLAMMMVPYGTVAVANPFFQPHAPRGDDARRVASRVLSDTYHAFNLKNEDVLYDTLSESVVGDLVDEIYLDSRRRLTAGTREGTQVTVREVGVLEIGEPLGGTGAEQGFSYDCRWKVVARVQHLQHVHHRHNIYTGVLTLRSDGGRWKISGVELQSEDRMVVPWQAT
jgi:hydrogenase/urease accessory protein HupE